MGQDHKCKAATINITVNKEAILHPLMDHQKLTFKVKELSRAVHSGRKLSELFALLEKS